MTALLLLLVLLLCWLLSAAPLALLVGAVLRRREAQVPRPPGRVTTTLGRPPDLLIVRQRVGETGQARTAGAGRF